MPEVLYASVVSAPTRWLLRAFGTLVAGCALAASAPAARAELVELTELRVRRADDGVLLDFATRFELPRTVEDALHKGVPLHFVAEAALVRYRWYWRDARVAEAVRTWRLTYQPLTLNYRVAFGALAQTYDSLADAMAVVKRSASWRIAEPLAADDDRRYYVDFSFRLDTSLLPRPLQIGLGGQPEWQLAADRVVPLPHVTEAPARGLTPAAAASDAAR